MNENTEEKINEESEEPKVVMETMYIEDLIKKAVNAGRKAQNEFISEMGKEDVEKKYFKKTERLLYALPDLKEKVKQDELDLKNGELHVSIHGRKSKDSIKFSKSQSILSEELQNLAIENSRRGSMERTKREIERIDKALELIRWRDKDKAVEDQYFGIIELKYFYGMKEEDIAELDGLKCNPSTIYRNKGRLVGRLKNILFGADALPRE